MAWRLPGLRQRELKMLIDPWAAHFAHLLGSDLVILFARTGGTVCPFPLQR